MKSKVAVLFLLGILFILSGFLSLNKQNKDINIFTNYSKDVNSVSQNDSLENLKTLGEKIVSGVDTGKVWVVKVFDGDTIETNLGEKIRYLGINSPEKGQPFFDQAYKLNNDLVLNKKVSLELDVQIKDRYGRTLAYVFADGVFINLEMIRKGLAVSQTIQPNVKYQDEIVKAQKEARDKCLGIWKGLCNTDQSNVLDSNSCIKIILINANAPGDDNKNKNGEWIEIKNTCQDQISMMGWLLKDNSASNKYQFKNFALDGNRIVKLHSGCGNDTISDIYWQCPEIKYAVWNNSGDHAFLYNDKGEMIADYQY